MPDITLTPSSITLVNVNNEDKTTSLGGGRISTIGAVNKLNFTLTCSTNMTGFDITLKPILFWNNDIAFNTAIEPSGFRINYNSSLSGATMQFFSEGGTFTDIKGRNGEAKCTYVSDTVCEIEYTYTVVSSMPYSDTTNGTINNWQTQNYQIEPRFLTSMSDVPLMLSSTNNNFNAVWGQVGSPYPQGGANISGFSEAFYVYIRKGVTLQSTVIHNPNDTKTAWYDYYRLPQDTIYEGNFYLLNGFTSFHTNETTSCRFTCKIDNTPSKLFVGLLKYEYDFNAGNVLDQIEWKEITAINTSGTDIITPFTDAAPFVFPGVYAWEFSIGILPYGTQCRLIGVVYDDSGYTASFISPMIESTHEGYSYCIGTGRPSYAAVTSTWYDVNNSFVGGGLTATVGERLKHELHLNYNFNKWQNNIISRFGVASPPNDLREYIKAIRVSLRREYFVGMNEYKDYYFERSIGKYGINVLVSSNGINTSNNIDYLQLDTVFDCEFDETMPCLKTYINNVLNAVPSGDRYFGGKQFILSWEIDLDYNNIGFNFQETLYTNHILNVKDFENDMSIINTDVSGTIINPNTSYSTVGNFTRLKATLSNNDINKDWYMESRFKTLGNAVNYEEEVTADELGVVTTNILDNLDDKYTVNGTDLEAVEFLHQSNVPLNVQNRVVMIAKQSKESYKRLLEDGDVRLTEIIQQRVLDKQI